MSILAAVMRLIDETGLNSTSMVSKFLLIKCNFSSAYNDTKTWKYLQAAQVKCVGEQPQQCRDVRRKCLGAQVSNEAADHGNQIMKGWRGPGPATQQGVEGLQGRTRGGEKDLMEK